MFAGNAFLFDGEANGIRGNAQEFRCLRQIHPTFGATPLRLKDRNVVMVPQRDDSPARPTVAPAGAEVVSVENAGDDVVRARSSQHPDGRDDILGSRRALTPFSTGQ